jgi:hypothetical protein
VGSFWTESKHPTPVCCRNSFLTLNQVYYLYAKKPFVDVVFAFVLVFVLAFVSIVGIVIVRFAEVRNPPFLPLL